MIQPRTSKASSRNLGCLTAGLHRAPPPLASYTLACIPALTPPPSLSCAVSRAHHDSTKPLPHNPITPPPPLYQSVHPQIPQSNNPLPLHRIVFSVCFSARINSGVKVSLRLRELGTLSKGVAPSSFPGFPDAGDGQARDRAGDAHRPAGARVAGDGDVSLPEPRSKGRHPVHFPGGGANSASLFHAVETGSAAQPTGQCAIINPLAKTGAREREHRRRYRCP